MQLYALRYMKPSHFDDVYLNEKKGIEIYTSSLKLFLDRVKNDAD